MAGQRLVVGLVRGLHGLDGTMRVEVLSDDPARFEPGAVLHVEGASAPLTVAWSQPDPPGLLVRFAEVRGRQAAEPYRDRYLEVEAEAERLAPGAVWWHEVLGAAVTTTHGEPLGQVTDVFRAGGSEVYVVQGPRGEVLVPGVRDVVVDFAPREGRLVVDAGVLDLGPPRTRRARGRRSSKAGPGTAPGHPSGPGPEA